VHVWLPHVIPPVLVPVVPVPLLAPAPLLAPLLLPLPPLFTGWKPPGALDELLLHAAASAIPTGNANRRMLRRMGNTSIAPETTPGRHVMPSPMRPLGTGMWHQNVVIMPGLRESVLMGSSVRKLRLRHRQECRRQCRPERKPGLTWRKEIAKTPRRQERVSAVRAAQALALSLASWRLRVLAIHS
jgi:hypothetical protein